jgi:hypothetical protein
VIGDVPHLVDLRQLEPAYLGWMTTSVFAMVTSSCQAPGNQAKPPVGIQDSPGYTLVSRA